MEPTDASARWGKKEGYGIFGFRVDLQVGHELRFRFVRGINDDDFCPFRETFVALELTHALHGFLRGFRLAVLDTQENQLAILHGLQALLGCWRSERVQ